MLHASDFLSITTSTGLPSAPGRNMTRQPHARSAPDGLTCPGCGPPPPEDLRLATSVRLRRRTGRADHCFDLSFEPVFGCRPLMLLQYGPVGLDEPGNRN